MKKNIGNEEAHTRTTIAVLTLLVAIFIENTTLRILLAVIAAILSGTSFLRFCPIYALLKKTTFETRKMDTSDQEAVSQVETESIPEATPENDTEKPENVA